MRIKCKWVFEQLAVILERIQMKWNALYSDEHYIDHFRQLIQILLVHRMKLHRNHLDRMQREHQILHFRYRQTNL